MRKSLFYTMFFLIGFFTSCHQPVEETSDLEDFKLQGKGVLLTTRFNSFEELKKEIKIEYSKDKKSWVRLTQVSENQKITSVLRPGITEAEIVKARDGGLLGKIKLTLSSPYFVIHRHDILRSYILSRRKSRVFGGGDVAFYDLAETMMKHIDSEGIVNIPEVDFSEKGYINTFNHTNSQAIMTILFSEEVADFIADTHERSNMPELISGKFKTEQINDIKNGPVDNYVDIINNEWGQELGKLLKKKYEITSETTWTPKLLMDILNDLQSHYSWVFQMRLEPFKEKDNIVLKFSKKINRVMETTSKLR